MGPAAAVTALVAPLLEAEGLELVDVELTGGILRVSVDRDGGVDLDTVALASQRVSDALDAADPDPVPGRYTLEVSSPGVERPLRTPAHFRRFLGSTVAVRTQPGVEGDRRIEGPLEAADDQGITVGGRFVAYADVERARTVFQWGAAPKPARPKKPTKKKAASV